MKKDNVKASSRNEVRKKNLLLLEYVLRQYL